MRLRARRGRLAVGRRARRRAQERLEQVGGGREHDGFSAYLTQQAVVDIGATCQWCLASFGLMTALAAVSVARLLRGA